MVKDKLKARVKGGEIYTLGSISSNSESPADSGRNTSHICDEPETQESQVREK